MKGQVFNPLLRVPVQGRPALIHKPFFIGLDEQLIF